MVEFKNTIFKATMMATCAFLVSCAQIPSDIRDDSDPWESFNRDMYEVTYAVDVAFLKPVTQAYRYVVPEPGRAMVHNFFENITSPITFGNSVLQADGPNTMETFWRFVFNSSFGIGGLFDVASDLGLHNRKTDFGQTLALYGVDSGPYLFIPILGPSNVRDGLGRVVDLFMNPVTYVNDTGTAIGLWTMTTVDARNDNYQLINDIYASSLDPYVTFRSGYTQKRTNDIKKARKSRDADWKQDGIIK